MALFSLIHDPDNTDEEDDREDDFEEEEEEFDEEDEDAIEFYREQARLCRRPEDDMFPFDYPTDELDRPHNHNDGEFNS